MAYSFPNGLKPKLLHTVVMRAFKMNKTQRNQNHSLEVVFECIWFFRHFGEVVSHSPDKNIQNPCLQPAMPHAREIFFHIWGRSTLEMCHICFCRQAQIPAHRIVGHLDRFALEARKADFQRKTMLQLIQWFWSQNFSNVLWEAAISGIHMDLCLNLKSLDIFSWCG